MFHAKGELTYIIDFGVKEVLIKAMSLVIDFQGKTFSCILVSEWEVIIVPSSGMSSHYAKSIHQ